MPAERVLGIIALAAAIVAAIALTGASVRAFLLAKRLQELADQVGRTLEKDVRPALAEVAETARGLRQTAGKIEAAIGPLEHALHWVAALASGLLGRKVPSLGVLTGLSRSIGGIFRHGRGSDGNGPG